MASQLDILTQDVMCFFSKKNNFKTGIKYARYSSRLVEQNIDFLIFYYIKVFTALHKNAPNSSKRL